MKIKVYLVLFLIFNHCFVFPLKNCDFISIDPKDYDFSLIDRGGEITKTKIIDEKIIYAFNYNYLPRFKSKVGDQIYPILLRVNELKQEKYDLDFLGSAVNYLVEDKKTNVNLESLYTEHNEEDSKIKDSWNSNITEEINKYKKIKEDESSFLSVCKGTLSNTIKGGGITGLFTSIFYYASSKLGFSSAAKISVSMPMAGVLIAGTYILFSLYSVYRNGVIEAKIKESQIEMYKATELYYKLRVLMINHQWIGNNIILAAISIKQECTGNEIQFYNYINFHYKNNLEVMKNMAKLTCLYRSRECEYDICFDNLMNYTNCIVGKLKGKIKVCPTFTENCSLKKDKEEYEYLY